MPKAFYKDIELEISSGVYEPREDSFLLAHELEKILDVEKPKKVLDIGCGSGLLAIIAAKAGCEVTAVDIIPETLECAKRNADANEVKIKFILSDLFSKVFEKFDLIVFNPPYLPEKISADSRVWAAGKNLELILGAVAEAGSHILPNGKLLMVASSLTGKEKIIKAFEQDSFETKIIAEKKIPWETLYVISVQKPNL